MRLREKALAPLLKGSSILSLYLTECSFPKSNIYDYLFSIGLCTAATAVGIEDIYKYMYKKIPISKLWQTKGLSGYKYVFLPVMTAGALIAAYGHFIDKSLPYEWFLRGVGCAISFYLWYASDHFLTKYNVEHAKTS